MRTSFTRLHSESWLAWLLRLVFAIHLQSCGGRSDQNAVAPITDAKVADRDKRAGRGKPGRSQCPDASSTTPPPLTYPSTAPIDVRRCEGRRELDASQDVRDALVDVRPEGGPDASMDRLRLLVSIAVAPPTAGLARGRRSR